MPNHAKERQEVAHLVAVIRRPIALLDIDVEMVVAVPGRKLEVLDPRPLKAGRDAAFVRHRAEAIHAERIDLGDLRIGNVDARCRLPPVRPEAPRIVPHGVRVARGENLRPAHAARGRNETRTAARQEVKFTCRIAIRQSLREAARQAVRRSPVVWRTIAVFLQLRLTPRRLLVRQNRVIGGDGLPLRLKPVRPTNRKDARAETHRQFGNRLPPVLFQRERAEPRARTGMVTTASARTAWVQAVMASTSAR